MYTYTSKNNFCICKRRALQNEVNSLLNFVDGSLIIIFLVLVWPHSLGMLILSCFGFGFMKVNQHIECLSASIVGLEEITTLPL